MFSGVCMNASEGSTISRDGSTWIEKENRYTTEFASEEDPTNE